jgi:hypothetical protein
LGYVVFSYLGRQVIIEEHDQEEDSGSLVNVTSLIAVFASAGLLAPQISANNVDSSIVIGALGLVGIIVIVAISEEKQELGELEPKWLEEDHLQDWDTQLRHSIEEYIGDAEEVDDSK